MKKLLNLLLSFAVIALTAPVIHSQCNAQFTWEQIPNTLTIHFNNTSTSEQDIISNFWNFGDGHNGDGENPNHTYEEAGTYLVCLTIETESGCEDDVCHEVTVEPLSSECHAEFTWEQIPGTLQIHFNSTSTSPFDITSYSWTFGDGDQGDGENPYHTYEEAGEYLVCLIITDSEGCVSDVCHEITVAPVSSECNAEFTWEQIPGTLQIHFNSTSTSGFDIVSYQWNFGDGHNGDGDDPYHTYEEPGVYLVCLIITDAEGCVSDVCHEVTVNEIESECNANFTWEQFDGTYEVDFTNTSTSDHEIISFQWFFGDGSQGDGPNPSHTYDEPGVYNVCLVITNEAGCISEECHEIHVEETSGECHAQFTWEQIPGTLQIHFNSTSTSQYDITSYSWTFGDGEQGDGENPYHTYEEPGVYLVCLIITDANGCVSDVCHEVHVEEPESDCQAAFTWEIDSLTVHFFSQSTSDHEIISTTWHFGDGGTGDGTNPIHIYDHPGVYVVCIRIEDNTGCVSELCHEVHVQESEGDCQAGFEWNQIDNTFEVHFESTSTSNHDIISYLWHFGDGSSGDGQNPYHTYDGPGTYVVCLRIEDNTGCVSEICHEVTIEGEEGCHAIFTWDLIPGTNNVHFFNQSTSEHDIISYQWTFGDGHSSNDQNPTHEYSEPGTYVVCLRIEDNTGCVSEICHEVHVNAEGEECHAQFTWEQIPGTLQIHFNSTSTSQYDITSYQWNFGDGHNGDGDDPYHTYEEPGVYLVCLIITDAHGCVSDVCHEIVVEPLSSGECNAEFSFEVNEEGVVFFNNNSSGGTDHTTWFWDFDDGETSTEENPHHVYEGPGLYTVCLTMADSTLNCSDLFCLTVTYSLGLNQDSRTGHEKAGTFSKSFVEGRQGTRYTNPADESIYIDYYLAAPTSLTIELFDLTGNRVIADLSGIQLKGQHQHTLDISKVNPGMYILSLTTATERKTMVVNISR